MELANVAAILSYHFPLANHPDLPDFDALRDMAAAQEDVISVFALEVLLLSSPAATMPSSSSGDGPAATMPSSSSDDGSNTGVIAGLVVAGVVLLLVVVALVVAVAIYFRVKHQKRY